jgi:murein DD-endopeptidase MepM/ murein hydrolase activator NlpD
MKKSNAPFKFSLGVLALAAAGVVAALVGPLTASAQQQPGTRPGAGPPAGAAPPRAPTVQRPPVVPPTTTVAPAVPAAPTPGSGPAFQLPVQCRSAEECFVQNYVDVDAGPAARDYTCGPITYDRHTGVDVRVPNMEAVRRGVPVIAAAPGVVRGTRDGLDDVNFREIGDEAVRGKECGNGVLVNHGDGWVSQYCHLRKDSIVVQNGQQVAAGDRLGFIGMSGKAEFPHVHFEVRFRGTPIDPFTGANVGSGCDAPRNPLFSKPALDWLAYKTAGLLNAGFSDAEPKAAEVLEGGHQKTTFLPNATRVYFWVETYGRRRNDRERFILRGPAGNVLAQGTQEATLEYSARSLSHLVAPLRENASWPLGTYRGEYTLERNTGGDNWQQLVTLTRTMDMRSPFAPPASSASAPSSPPDVRQPAAPPASDPAPARQSPAPAAEPLPSPRAAPEGDRVAAAVSSTLGEAANVASAVQRAASAAASAVLPRQANQRKGPPLWMLIAVLLGALLVLSATA